MGNSQIKRWLIKKPSGVLILKVIQQGKQRLCVDVARVIMGLSWEVSRKKRRNKRRSRRKEGRAVLQNRAAIKNL
tara:strand:- start:503 stop:727 length:225 start_codon:yes stop_codon:yes gene_type:complete